MNNIPADVHDRLPQERLRPPRDVVLSATGLSHSYVVDGASHDILTGIDIEVHEGEFVTIVGPSGTGKSTLLRCAAGFVKPTKGAVTVLGRAVDGIPADMAVVFQDYSRSLFPWMRVARNVDFPLRATGVPRAERHKRVSESLAAVGLAGSERKYPWQLSGGMQQRVAIARALASQPRILLMDEPFASVDAQTRAELEDLTLSVRDQFGITVILVTHDIDESVYLSDRVIVLHGSPARIAHDIPVRLPHPRSQIATRSNSGFVELRTEVASCIKGV